MPSLLERMLEKESDLMGGRGSASTGSGGGAASAPLEGDAADAALQKEYATFLSSLSEEDRNLLTDYTSSSYMELNDFIRGLRFEYGAPVKPTFFPGDSPYHIKTKTEFYEHQKALYEDLLDKTTRLTALMDRAPGLKSPLIAYRGLLMKNVAYYHVDYFQKLEQALKKGKVAGWEIEDKGFGSTTTHDSVASEFASKMPKYTGLVLKINIPKGTKGAYVKAVSKEEGENEFLMPPGFKLRLTGKVESIPNPHGKKPIYRAEADLVKA